MPFLAPLIPAVTAFAGTWVGQLIIGTAVSFGVSMLKDILNPKKAQQQQANRPNGFRLNLSVGDDVPAAFSVGYSATGGTRKYIGAWGNSGEVPNAYLTEVIQVGDLPLPGATTWDMWANKQRCTFGTVHATLGYPVLEFRVSGVDHMWIKFRNGTETTVDALLLDKFGSHPDYPWSSDMIGRGAPHMIITTLINRELFSGQPTFIAEPPSVPFYDLRLDSTNGGSGLHRWDDPATWAPSTNPVVIMYNIIRGIYYGDEWFYGGRNLPAFRLPSSSWIAAANECDVEVDLVGGGTEPQFRCGLEISVDQEPLAVIEELKRACNARLSEIGGIFEILVGAPGAAVYSFTDDDIVISRGQTYNSFPGLNSTHNGIEATYPEPSEMWALKDAPARYVDTYMAEDGERRLATGVQLSAVPYAVQAQRVMKTLLDDDRRWRTHYICLPPSAWILTGTCVVSWTSERNGYINKKFLAVRVEGEPGMMQPAVLREIDPTDYTFTTDDELPHPVGELVIVRPAVQPFSGLQVFPATIYDTDGEARRPTIRIQYDGGMPDIQFVHVLVRLASSGDYIFEQYIPFAVPYVVDLNGVFLPNTTYEVAARYVPYSGRPTEFSAYLSVTTPNVKLVSGKDFDPFEGTIGFDSLGDDLSGYQNWIGQNLRTLIEEAEAQATLTAGQELANAFTFKEVRQEVASSLGNLDAVFQEVITTAIIPLQGQMVALADAVTTLSAADDGDVSTARFRITALTGPTGYARIGGETRFDNGDPDDWRSAAFYLDTPTSALLPTRFLVDAQQFVLIDSSDPDNVEAPFIFEDGVAKMVAARIGTVTAGRLESSDGASFWDLTTGAFRIST